MAEEMIFGLKIKGDASGAIGAVGQALSAFQKLDAKLKAGANRAIGSMTTPLANVDQIGQSKDIAAWSKRQDLELAKQRMLSAQSDLANYVKNASAKERSSEKFYNRVQALDKRATDAAISYARKVTGVVVSEKKAQENAAKKLADEQIRNAQRAANEQRRVATQFGRNFQNVINQSIASVGTFGNSFRLLSQGFSELGRVLSMFIAAPIAAMFLLSARTAIDFEAAIVRVGKTTGLEGKKLQDLTAWIREFAKSTSSSQTELAVFAEQLGQLNVTDTNAMKRLIATVEMMANATDMSADEITKSVGRIATAFGYDLNKEGGVRAVEKLANTINMLENKTAASAGEIIEGLLNVASVGGMLDIPVDDMSAVVAMMISMGVNADAVGNRMTRFYQQLITKSDDAAKFMKGFTTEVVRDGKKIIRTYSGDSEEFMSWLNEDKTQVLTDFMVALGNAPEESKLDAMADWFELVGRVGGKVGVLAGNTRGLGEALAIARKEFESGNSLFVEYDKMLMTTQAHTKILRNNLNDAAITLGDAFLPTINRLVEYAVPAIQILTAAFKSLTFETKMLIVGIPLLVAVVAPLIFFFSQMAHAIGMIFMGFQTLMVLSRNVGVAIFSVGKAVFLATKLIRGMALGGAALGAVMSGGLAPALLSVGAALLGIVAAGGAVFVALKALQARGVDIAGFFQGIAQRAGNWGEGLMHAYAGGLIGGAAKYVSKAISMIANWIASFFESHSPPKEGPLSKIDKWGGPLFTTFLSGFAKADFSILEEVGNTIRSILDKMFDGDDADVVVGTMVANARVALAELIDTFNRTGDVAQGLLDKIVAGTGHLGEDVKKLITLWLKYEKTQRRIKELEKSRQKVHKGYEEEVARIAASNLSAEQKAEQIRAAMFKRNNAVDAIDKEKKAEEEKAEALKDQLEWQKEFIKAQVDQASIFDKIAKALDKMGGALADLGGMNIGSGGGGDCDPLTDPDCKPPEPFKDIETTIKKRLDSARKVIKAFMGGLRGENFQPLHLLRALGVDDETIAEMKKAHEWGTKIFDLFNPKKQKGGGDTGGEGIPVFEAIKSTIEGIGKAFEETITNIGTLFDNPAFKNALKTFEELGDLLFSPKKQGEMANAKDGWREFGYWVGLTLGAVALGAAAVINWLVVMIAFILGIPVRLEEFSKKFDEWTAGFREKMRTLWALFGESKDAVEAVKQDLITAGKKIFGFILEGLQGDPEWFNNLMTYLSDGFGKLSAKAVEWGEDLVEQYGVGLVSGAGAWIAEKVGAVGKAIADYLEPHSPPKMGPLSTINTWGGKLLALFLEGFTLGDFNPIEKIASKVGDALHSLFGGGQKDVSLVGMFVLMLDGIITAFTEKIPTIQDQWQQIKDMPTKLFGVDYGTVVVLPIYEGVWTALTTWFTTNTPLMRAKWDLFRDTFQESFKQLPGMVGVLFTSLMFQPEVVEAMKIAMGLFYSKGGEFASAVGQGINGMAGAVVGEMNSLVEGLILEIDRAIAAVDSLVVSLERLNAVSSVNVGVSGSSAVGLASGGIAVRPTLAMIAEGGEAEAVIPLSKLPGLISSAMPTPDTTQIVFNINNPNFKDDNNMRKVLREVRKDLTATIRDQKRMRGRS